MPAMKYYLLPLLCLVAACNKPAPQPDVTTGLVADIRLNGEGYDLVSNTTGTAYNITATENRYGLANRAVHFNAADSAYINFGDLEGLSFTNGAFTISCFVKVEDTSKPVAVLSKRGINGPWEYSLDNHFNHAWFNLDNWVEGGNPSVYGVDPLDASATIHTGHWQHLAYVADGSTLRVYVDGAQQPGIDSLTPGAYFTNTNAHFVIGNGGAYNKNWYFTGAIDDIKIYNRALEPAAIALLSIQ